jgi:hypothetical protein
MDDAYDFFIEFLRGIAPGTRPQHGNHNCDLWLPNVASEFARRRVKRRQAGQTGPTISIS